jgi:putative membrane protein
MRFTWKNGILLAAGFVFALGGTIAAQTTDAKTSAADVKFAKEAAMGGMMEVDLGKVAVQKASNAKVKEFGQRMADDHSKAADQLKSIAAKENITLPTELDAKHKAMVDKMSSLSGAEFDRAYMADMVKDHQHDVADFQKESTSGSDDTLKAWAGKTLPTLQEHLRIAKETDSSLGATSRK